MNWSDLDFHPSARTLRQFAWIWLAVVGALGTIREFHGKRFGLTFIGAAIIVGVIGTIRPRLIQPLYAGMIATTFPIGWIVSRLLLGIIYFGVFTPVSILFKLAGRDALRRRRQEAQSYWQDKNQPRDPVRYLRQF
jgi:membrane protein implicated in regulation of membrane protease activity